MPRRFFLPMGIGLSVLVVGMLLKHGGVLVIAIPPILFSCLSVIFAMRLKLPTLHVRRTVSRHRMIEGEEIEAFDINSGQRKIDIKGKRERYVARKT